MEGRLARVYGIKITKIREVDRDFKRQVENDEVFVCEILKHVSSQIKHILLKNIANLR